jgi:hypothetical protein
VTGSAERTFSIAAGVTVRRLGDEVLVYVEARFETHLLSWACGLLVETLNSADAPLTSQQLQHRLFAAEPAGNDDDDGDGDDSADDGEALLAPLLTHLLGLGVLSAQPC